MVGLHPTCQSRPHPRLPSTPTTFRAQLQPDDTDEPPEGRRSGRTNTRQGAAEPEPSKPTQFYAQFNSTRRGIKQLGDRRSRNSKLRDVEAGLEIRATSDEGFDEATRRTVSENARSLGAQSSEFE